MKSHWIHGFVISSMVAFGCTQAHAAMQQTVNPAANPTAAVAPAANPAAQAKQAGEAFMQTNKAKQGIVTLPSGLQYQIVEPGTGKKPTATDTVTVDYEGRLLNGQVFDSSYQRGQPATFPVNGVIAGWQEALQLMNSGSTWMLFIPSKLAYGESGAGGVIGPNETLIFKVHLINVK